MSSHIQLQRSPRRSLTKTILLPGSLILAIVWTLLPKAKKQSVRSRLALQLIKLAQFIGGPGFAATASATSGSASRSVASTSAGRQHGSASKLANKAAVDSESHLVSGAFPKPQPPLFANTSTSSASWIKENSVDPDELSSEDDTFERQTRSTVTNISRPSSSASSNGVPASIHKPHRHTLAAEQALQYLVSLEPLTRWDFQQEKNGIRISTMPLEGDPRYESGESLEYFSVDEALSYSVQKGTFPVASRDLVSLLTCRRQNTDGLGKLIYVATSVNDPTAPSEGRGRVRAHLTVAGWILRQRKEGGIEASYIVQVDPKGTVPSALTALVKLIQTQTPQCIFEVSKYLVRAGPIPFIVRDNEAVGPGSDVSLMLEEYDPQTSIYTLDLTIRTTSPSTTTDSRRGVVSVALPRNVFSSGADINVMVTPAGGADVRAKLLMGSSDRSTNSSVPDILKGIVGNATVSVVQFWIEGSDGEVELEVRMEPGRHGVVFNGEPLDP
ncbi:hypothetical protein HDV05_007176 [Chytridiales sp. JEL 0842]|nr:hypothetical protein HDV05_007176 [Chytridiales sp. JEL 0842]